jgi:hypothetical protein
MKKTYSILLFFVLLLITPAVVSAIENDADISDVSIFSEEEQDFIEVLQTKVEGETLKQKNPYPKKSLAWAAWTIARIAGWTGYFPSWLQRLYFPFLTHFHAFYPHFAGCL